jgi:hypothetical protein
MTTPSEWIDRVNDSINDAVDTMLHIAPIGRCAWLGRFEERVRNQWRPVFAGMLSPADVDSLVANVTQTIMGRLAEIERGGATLH